MPLMRDESGNMLALSAMGMLLMAALIGGGVDMSRAYMAKNRLQAACDAGVLAGRKAVLVNGYDTSASAMAQSYFNANYDATDQTAKTAVFNSTSPDNGNTVIGTASSAINTMVMQIFGKTGFNLAVECRASMGVGNSDVTMVLDTTGSMSSLLAGSSQTRLQALQDAMKNFYTTVKTATGKGNARIRYAFVPYSSSVNVGRLLDPNYLVDNDDIQSREPIYRTETYWGTPVTTSKVEYGPVSNGSLQYYTTAYNTAASCSSAQPSTAWTDTGTATRSGPTTTTNSNGQQVVTTTTTQQQTSRTVSCVAYGGKYYATYYDSTRTKTETRYDTSDPTTRTVFDRWNYRKINFDTRAYKRFSTVNVPMGTDGADMATSWEGCIEERASTPAATFSYSTLSKTISPSASDLDIDSAPSSDATKWAPMWPELAYLRYAWVATRTGGSYQLTNAASSEYGSKVSSSCPSGAQLFKSMNQSEFNAYADSLHAEGNTYHDIGMVWGARLSSPNGMFSSLVNLEPNNGGKVSRHLIFMTDGIMEPNYSIQSSWGIEYHDRRVTTDGSSGDATRHTSRFQALCEAVKGKGIRIWVIAFSAALTTSLEQCASDDSAFTATDADELNAAFQEIGKQVGELRITQ